MCDYMNKAKKIAAYFKAGSASGHSEIDYRLVDERLPVLIAMGLLAGAEALGMHKRTRRGEFDIELQDKGDRTDGYSSPLTVADKLVHEKTIDFYMRYFPQDSFEGEEGACRVDGADVIVVQDEIDGTQNFSVGTGGFSYVNGIYVKSRATGLYEHMTSLVFDPVQSTLFIAVLGEGAHRFELDADYNIIHSRPIGVANLNVYTSKFAPYILMDTMGLGEDPILRCVLQKIGYKVEPQSGSGLKVAAVASEGVVCAMFRSQRGNPDPGDVALASLLVTEGSGSLATSISGGALLNNSRQFYDGYAIGGPLAHRHIVEASKAISDELNSLGKTQDDLTPSQWEEIAQSIADDIE